MDLKWEQNTLKIEGINSLGDVFEAQNIQKLERFNDEKEEKLITKEYFLLNKIPLFIYDGGRKNEQLSVNNTFKYYYQKLSAVLDRDQEIYFSPYNLESNKFELVEDCYEYSDIYKNVIEEKIVAGVSSQNLHINPMFFDKLYAVYSDYKDDNIDYIFNLKNFFSAFFLSDKLKVKGNEVTISYYNVQENIYNNLVVNWSNLSVSRVFSNILNWVFESVDDKSIFDLRYKVAKIYISNLGKINQLMEDKDDVTEELSSLYEMVLSRESKNFYEYQNMMNDEYFKLLQEKSQIITNKNKSSMNLIISFPIALYGVYLTTFQNEESFTLLSSQFNFVYISFLIASIFMFIATLYEIYLLNKSNKQILDTIENTYNINIEKWEEMTNLIWWKDFAFPLIILVIISIILLILIVL